MLKRVFFRRVDVQSTIISTAISIIATLLCFVVIYTITFNDIKSTLNNRANAICDFVGRQLEKEDFINITTDESINEERYTILHKNLHEISDVTRATYVFTAYNDNGTPRYHITNLHEESQHFKYPGEEITNQTKEKIIKALNGEKVILKDFVEIEDGCYYRCYLPIFDENGEVLGAIGILFNVERQYNTYSNLRKFVPVILVFACVSAGIISFLAFKRISNPSKHDMLNIDFMTGVKNRNAYQIELDSIVRSHQNINTCIIMIDLNGLKKVNDKFGHDEGDKFIISLTKAYHNLPNKPGVMYRIGGDEFIIIVKNATEELIQKSLNDFMKSFNKTVDISLYSYSVGYAIFDPKQDTDIRDTVVRADELMYVAKNYNKK